MMSGAILTGTVLTAVALVVSPAARRAGWTLARGLGTAVGGLAVLAVLAATRHWRQPVAALPRQATPAVRTWQVTVYGGAGGNLARLRTGTVTGPWNTAADVQTEILVRWTDRYGPPAEGGRLYCRAILTGRPRAAQRAGTPHDAGRWP